jgi:hypothetical protein
MSGESEDRAMQFGFYWVSPEEDDGKMNSIKLVRDAAGESDHGNPDKKRSILKATVSNCTMTSGNLHYS